MRLVLAALFLIGNAWAASDAEKIRYLISSVEHMPKAKFIRNGKDWYLLYSGAACCGKQCNYAIGVARARSPLGPYRKPRDNPLVRANRAWRCPGHVGAVRDARGDLLLLYHAYPARGFGYVGRQALLDRVRFKRGWPVVGRARTGPSWARSGRSTTCTRSLRAKTSSRSRSRAHRPSPSRTTFCRASGRSSLPAG